MRWVLRLLLHCPSLEGKYCTEKSYPSQIQIVGGAIVSHALSELGEGCLREAANLSKQKGRVLAANWWGGGVIQAPGGQRNPYTPRPFPAVKGEEFPERREQRGAQHPPSALPDAHHAARGGACPAQPLFSPPHAEVIYEGGNLTDEDGAVQATELTEQRSPRLEDGQVPALALDPGRGRRLAPAANRSWRRQHGSARARRQLQLLRRGQRQLAAPLRHRLSFAAGNQPPAAPPRSSSSAAAASSGSMLRQAPPLGMRTTPPIMPRASLSC